jgi:hypothetical protein
MIAIATSFQCRHSYLHSDHCLQIICTLLEWTNCNPPSLIWLHFNYYIVHSTCWQVMELQCCKTSVSLAASSSVIFQNWCLWCCCGMCQSSFNKMQLISLVTFWITEFATIMVSDTSEAKQWGAYTSYRPHHVNNSKVTPKFFVQGFMNYEFLVLSCLDNIEVSNNTLYFVCMVHHIKIRIFIGKCYRIRSNSITYCICCWHYGSYLNALPLVTQFYYKYMYNKVDGNTFKWINRPDAAISQVYYFFK